MITSEEYLSYITENKITVSPSEGIWWAITYPGIDYLYDLLKFGTGYSPEEALIDFVDSNPSFPRLKIEKEKDYGDKFYNYEGY